MYSYFVYENEWRRMFFGNILQADAARVYINIMARARARNGITNAREIGHGNRATIWSKRSKNHNIIYATSY